MTISVLSSESQAETVWRQLVPADTLFDTWELRSAFWRPFRFPLHFILAESGGKPAALLPLQFNSLKEKYEIFGGSWMECNRMGLAPGADDAAIRAVLAAVPEPVELEYFAEQIELRSYLEHMHIEQITELAKYHDEEFVYRYTLPLAGLTTPESVIDRQFHGKSRANFLRHLRHLHEQHQVVVESGSADDMAALAELNKLAFGEISGFHRPHRTEIFDSLARNSFFDSHIFRVRVDGEIAAVAYSILYRGVYYGMNSGVHPGIMSGFGNFVRLQKILDAIRCGARIYDAMGYSYNWKTAWHLDKTPQYRLVPSAR